MVDTRTRVIGINTAIIRMAQGISLAIPIDTAEWVVGELLARGRVSHAYLGIVGQTPPIDRLVARRHALSVSQAVEIISVEPHGPAAIAGLREEDLIVALNERAVRTVDDMHRMLVGRLVGPVEGLAVAPKFLDVTLPPGTAFREPVPRGHTAFAYVEHGEVRFGPEQTPAHGPPLVVFGAGDVVEATAGPAGGRFLVAAARPLHEPIARYGPFVMNTRAESRR